MMILRKHEKSFVKDGQGGDIVIEHVEYCHTIDAFGNTGNHRVVLNREVETEYPMPDGTVKTTSDIISDIS